MASVTINVDGAIDQIIQQKFSELGDNTTMIAIHNTLAKRCDPYVPFLEGPLSQTAIVSAHGVRYIQPYARYQYYGIGFRHTTDYHPLASALWDEAMLRDHGEEFFNEIKDLIVWRINHSG